jgi:ArsR family transcriptional regulator, arsenate/arsenite/antimonite-responsive transcriptional repressor
MNESEEWTTDTDRDKEADLDAMFRALGDPSRRRVFEFLRGCCCTVAIDEASGEVRPASGVTVGEVCCAVPLSQATISQHLKALREAGLIVTERDGKFIRCGVDPRALSRLAAYFGSDTSQTEKTFIEAESPQTLPCCGPSCCAED